MWADADIALIAVVTERSGVKGVPVIAVIDPFHAPGEDTGDIYSEGGDLFEAQIAAEECDRVWRKLGPGASGPVAVVAGRFVGLGLTRGVAPPPPFSMRRNGPRWEDLCAEPRALSASDVLDIGPQTSSDRGWMVIQDFALFSDTQRRDEDIAHELGHVLYVGHGDGVDNDDDGTATPGDGVRRYDEYCDPLGSGEDEQASPPPACSASLMMPSPCTTNLTDLQAEQARAAAAVMPGCKGSPCTPG